MIDPVRTLEHRGCALSYSVRGAGPPVLLIQGVSAQGDAWGPQVDALAPRFACLTFDNRGFSRSQPCAVPLTVEQMAEDALALVDAQGWPEVHVVGHSLGGSVALHLALERRARVRSLALLCTFARGRDATRLTWRMFRLGMRTRIGTRRMRRRAFLEMVLPPAGLAGIDRDAEAERLAGLFGHDLADHPPVVSQQLAALSRYDATARLSELAGLPTLVVSAVHDPISRPASGQALASGIPGARLVVLPDASHGVPLHDPARINALLLEHLAAAR